MVFHNNIFSRWSFFACFMFSRMVAANSLKLDPDLFNEQWELLLVLIGLALLPFMAVMCTSFTKIIVVLSIARQAIGTAQTPPNIVLMSVALMLTAFAMYPVGQKIYDGIDMDALPHKKTEAFKQVAIKAEPALKEFLTKHAQSEDKEIFLRLMKNARQDDLIILAPAFLISELSLAFQIGFLIYLPFLVIDMVVANLLMALGMQMLSPTTISLPFKILLFVLIDGWRMLAQGLLGV